MQDVGELLPKLADTSRKFLSGLIKESSFSGVIPAALAKASSETANLSLEALMVALLPLARAYARPPISNFYVGAVACDSNNNLYLGANLEIPGHSLGFSVHAEQSAIANAYMHRAPDISAVAVTNAPCGHCRQFMNELSIERDTRLIVDGSEPTTLSRLLPQSFGPKDLGASSGVFPLRTIDLFSAAASDDQLTNAALTAACRSYAPYSKSHSGVAIGTHSGRVVIGCYIENAAFNPSLSPLQVALSALVLAGETWRSISRVHLVELEGVPVSQRTVTEAVLSSVAPGIGLEVSTAKSRS
jgi:cytidine deaminase